jgi:hypothetical protein
MLLNVTFTSKCTLPDVAGIHPNPIVNFIDTLGSVHLGVHVAFLI